ncbi:MAG: FG-GAP repeat protein [Deltaproteobacteria bacterium]|nr:FG-GAP repeat protein [Deltaproteobacteria bacterium]
MCRYLFASLLILLALPGCNLTNPEQVDLDADGWVPDEDCDDNDASVNPGQGESCDGKDNDCDGAIDEGFDEDGDGWMTCGEQPDCNDSDPLIYPGAPERCNGLDDDGAGGGGDGDGDGVTACDGDCDDTDPTVYPGAPELCDGIDNSCDGVLADLEMDGDGDGATGCPGDDCDDSDPTIYPGAPEVCDGDDENCNGLIDEDFDADGDGVSSCSDPVDCNDADATVYPGAPELCDNRDNDCDGAVDEDTVQDADGDGWSACGGDCNDADPNISPDGLEFPDGVDGDCDGAIDEGWSGLGDASALTPVAWGAGTLEGRGKVLSNAGDINGDGLSDFITSNPSYGSGQGRAWIYLGTGFAATNPPAALTHLATITGAAGDELGSGVALADLDGDGFDDVIIGAPQSSSASPPAGKTYVFWGSPILTGGAWPTAAAGVTIAGSFATEQCGTDVATAGDANADGFDDLVVGCPWFDPGPPASGLRGRAQLFYGRTRSSWAAVSSATQYNAQWVGTAFETGVGNVVSDIGDHNGDGYGDFGLGSPTHSGGNGRACIVLGRAAPLSGSLWLDAADRCWTGVSAQGVGSYMTGGGDDGDPYEDLLIGGPLSNGGRGFLAKVIGGPSPWVSGPIADRWQFIVWGSVATEEAGSSGCYADLDGDGLSDIVAPTPGFDGPLGGDQGRVSILTSPDTQYAELFDPGDAPAIVYGEAGGDGFGSSTVALPDFNGDGAQDVAVGAPWSDEGAPGGGAVYILLGAP